MMHQGVDRATASLPGMHSPHQVQGTPQVPWVAESVDNSLWPSPVMLEHSNHSTGSNATHTCEKCDMCDVVTLSAGPLRLWHEGPESRAGDGRQP